MDRRFLTVLGVSLVFALVVSSIFYQMTAAKGSGSKRSEPSDMKDIVVAAKPMGVGVTVKNTDVRLEKRATDSFPKNAFSKIEDVVDRPVISNILLDEALLDGRLAARGSGLGLAPIIPVGMRAVSVRVNDVASVAGFVLPGMRVDILVTGRPPSSDQAMTSTVLQNLLVLSVGTNVQADAKGQAIQAPSVTLLATPEQAELLTLANSQGQVQLVLRNGGDAEIQKTSSSQTSQLFGGTKKLAQTDLPPRKARASAPPPMAVVKAPPPPPPPPDQVIVIRGDKRTVETMPSRPEVR